MGDAQLVSRLFSSLAMQPFEHEAQQILANARAALEPREHRRLREESAKKLVESFLSSAEAVGFKRGRTSDDQTPYILNDERSVRITTNGGGGIHLYRPDPFGGPAPDAHRRQAQLTFDYVSGEFFGGDVDVTVVPTPGQRVPREHALVVLARLAAELLTLEVR